MNLHFLDFFKDIGNFLRYRKVLGVDIGTSAVKVVELSRRADRIVFHNYGMLEIKDYLDRANAAIHSSSLKIVERDAVAFLKILLREMHPDTRHAIASIPSFLAFMVPIEIPLLSKAETKSALFFQARQYIPLPLEMMELDWVKIAEFDSPRGARFQRLLLTAIPKEVIKKYRFIFRESGLKLMALELEAAALARTWKIPGNPPFLTVDLGALSTSIAVMQDGVVKLSHQTDYGGAILTKAIARSLGVSPRRAEEIKRRRGLQTTGVEAELSTSLFPFLDVILQECERARKAFEQGTGNGKINHLVLTGGGAKLKGIREYFEWQIKLPVHHYPWLSRLEYRRELEPIAMGLEDEYAVAAALPQRYLTAE